MSKDEGREGATPDESELRERFMEAVYDELTEDGTNSRANRIIAAFDGAHSRLTAALADMTAERDLLKEERDAANKRAEAEVPEAVKNAVDRIIKALCIGSGYDLSSAASELWQAWEEWRGPDAREAPQRGNTFGLRKSLT